jgi:YesN/AraC family two-component response regulator
MALRLGVDDYLAKPFLDEELSTRIVNLLNRYSIRQQATEDAEKYDVDPGYDHQWLSRLEQVVTEHLTDADFSVDMLADALHISRRQPLLQTESRHGHDTQSVHHRDPA